MMLKYVLVMCISLLVLGFSQFALATNSVANKNNQIATVGLKCYVELLGGRKTIYTLYAFDPSPQNLANGLVGQSISPHFSKKEYSVYKVLECLPMAKKFSFSEAVNLERSIPR